MTRQSVRVCIVDYGSGNVRSVFNIFSSLHPDVRVSSAAGEMDEATHLVLPGVGAFGAAMEKIKHLGLIDSLERNVRERKKPFLGICVGMQVLAVRGHEYGTHDGLGWISGEVRKLNTHGLSLPHIGWNNCELTGENPLFKGITREMDFYFVHSYHLAPGHPADVCAVCEYGEKFAAAVCKDNIYGVQFHPEKSQKAGRLLAQNFLSLS